MNLAIVGTRNPAISYDEWEALLEKKLNLLYIDTIISGGAKGIDSYAKQFALSRNIPIIEIKPNYAEFGRCATLIRNKEIAEKADKIIAFPSQQSQGTYHTITCAKKLGKEVFIVTLE